ncbi:MAG: D-tyrosyl-tRNA(Tyr) deacylase [Clostridia bacterium]|nr:D-tyrosyl-tRNA(Tyr) deacylase [Clostridia bacterium]
MKAIIQRVNCAAVRVEEKTVGEIEKGFLILLGVNETDGEAEATLLARKVSDLRVFTDENDKMNLSLLDINGEALVVSNFTLCADTKKGNRPSFANAMGPSEANRLYEFFCQELAKNGVKNVQTGEFGADMRVLMEGNGPVTIVLDTDIWVKKNGN